MKNISVIGTRPRFNKAPPSVAQSTAVMARRGDRSGYEHSQGQRPDGLQRSASLTFTAPDEMSKETHPKGCPVARPRAGTSWVEVSEACSDHLPGPITNPRHVASENHAALLANTRPMLSMAARRHRSHVGCKDYRPSQAFVAERGDAYLTAHLLIS
jgi:hypothetical protein